MEKIIKASGEGKTTDLIKMADNKKYYIVCPNMRQAGFIQEQAKSLACDILFPLTYSEFINKAYQPRNIDGFLIDNADLFLQYMSPEVEIKAITIGK